MDQESSGIGEEQEGGKDSHSSSIILMISLTVLAVSAIFIFSQLKTPLDLGYVFSHHAQVVGSEDVWLAISPYDMPYDMTGPDSQIFSPKSLGFGDSVDAPMQIHDVPFCFEVDMNGVGHPSKDCLRKKTLNAQLSELSVCGIQNLGSGSWLPQIIDAPTETIARNIISFRENFHCPKLLLDFENITGDRTFKFTPKIVSLVRELKQQDQFMKPSDGTVQAPLQVPVKMPENIPEKIPVIISVAVYAKTSDAGEWEGPRGQDWEKICSVADELVIMAYDHTVPGHGSPGETAPLEWVKSVLLYAKSKCPTDKIRLGLAAFGYNWQTGEAVSERTYQSLLRASARSETELKSVLVETSDKRREKVELARSFGISKFLIWSKGQLPQ